MNVIKNECRTFTLMADNDEENTVINIINELLHCSWEGIANHYGEEGADNILNQCGIYVVRHVSEAASDQGMDSLDESGERFNFCSIPNEDFLLYNKI